MLFNVYSIKDVKVDFSNPFVFVSDEVAVRNVKFLVNDLSQGQSIFNSFVDDKELWLIGIFDTAQGTIVGNQKFISKLSDFKEVK